MSDTGGDSVSGLEPSGPSEDAVEAAAWAIAQGVGKRDQLFEEDWKRAHAALNAAYAIDRPSPGGDEVEADPTLDDECHLALWQAFHNRTRGQANDGGGEFAHELAVLAFRFYRQREEDTDAGS